jgi:predicted ABC-type ATPase
MEQARERGFKIASVFIGLSSAKLSLLRVKERAENGGHDVPSDIVERRFPNVMKNFPEMLKRSDVSVAFDNSYKAPYKLIFMMDRRKLWIFHSYPKWLENALKDRKTNKSIVHITKEEVDQMSTEKIRDMTQKILDSFNEKSK